MATQTPNNKKYKIQSKENIASIFPQQLVETEHKLKEVETKVSAMIHDYGNILNNQINIQKDNANQEDIHINQDFKQQASQIKNTKFQDQVNSQGEVKKELGSSIKKLRDSYDDEDRIDQISKNVMAKTIQFYQNKLQQSEQRYQQMRQRYLNLMKDNQIHEQVHQTSTHPNQQVNLQESKVHVSVSSECMSSPYKRIYESPPMKKKLSLTNNDVEKTPYNKRSISEVQIKQESEMKQQGESSQDQKLVKNWLSQQKMQNFTQKIKRLQQFIQQKQMLIKQQNNKIQQYKTKLNEKQNEILIKQQNMKIIEQKLKNKQKQLLKHIHTQSSFAAQQLTNMQKTIINMTESIHSQRMQYQNKISYFQQQIKMLKFVNEKQNAQIKQYQQMFNEQTSTQKILTQTQPPQTNHVFTDIVLKSENSTKSQVVNESQNEFSEIKADSEWRIGKENQNKKITSMLEQQVNEYKIKQPTQQNISIPSQMKRAKHKLTISPIFDIQKYYLKAVQVQKQTYLHKSSQYETTNENDKNDQDTMNKTAPLKSYVDILDVDDKQDDSELFTRVVSVRQNPQDQDFDQQTQNSIHLNLNLMKQVLLVPSNSIEQIYKAIQSLLPKIKKIRKIILQNSLDFVKKVKKYEKRISIQQKRIQLLNKQKQIKKHQNQQQQQNLNLTGYPLTNKQPHHHAKQYPIVQTHQHNSNTTNNIDMSMLNNDIYEIAQDLSSLCQTLMSNFQDQIIKYQGPNFINKLKMQKKKGIHNSILAKGQQADDSNNNQNNQLSKQKADQDTDAIKLINEQMQQYFSKYVHKQQNKNKTNDQQQQQSNETIYLQTDNNKTPVANIIKKLQQIFHYLNEKKLKLQIRNKERVQRLFDIIRSIIINFKASYKSIDNIISRKQAIQGNKQKYMHLRLYINQLYKALEKDTTTNISVQTNDSKQTQSSFTLYDSYEDKLQKLSNELSKIRLQLDQKTKQFLQLKSLTQSFIQIQNKISQQEKVQPNTQINSIKTNQQLTNNKTITTQNTNDSDLLLAELQNYKKKCSEYQSRINGHNGRKKTQKIIFVRK